VDRDHSDDPRQRWIESRALLKQASDALRDGRLDVAYQLFTKAHDLGDDDVVCHSRGHWGRARIELRTGEKRAAMLDAFFASVAVLFSPIRRLRGVRGSGFGENASKSGNHAVTQHSRGGPYSRSPARAFHVSARF
jgi:hypothetical protein